MEPKSPQEKKLLSYAKDRRNVYGENDKASRKSIRKRKSGVNRVYRRKAKEILEQLISPVDSEASEVIEAEAKNLKRPFWKKYADEPLGEVVERKLKRRVDHAGHGKTARKTVSEFLSRLEIEIEQETDGRWIAEAVGMNGVLVYGSTETDAIERCRSLAGAVFAEQRGDLQINSFDGRVLVVSSK